MRYLLYTSLLLIITLRFPCGGRKISSTIKKCQNIMNMTVGIKFQLNLRTFSFGPNLCRKGVSCGKEKFENHPWSINIQISVGTKFQLKWTILIFFFDQILPKEDISYQKWKKWKSPLSSKYLNCSRYQISTN